MSCPLVNGQQLQHKGSDRKRLFEGTAQVQKEPVEESQAKAKGMEGLGQATSIQGTGGYLTECELLADFAPPFARGAPYINRELNGQVIAFQLHKLSTSKELKHRERPDNQTANTSSKRADLTRTEETGDNETCQQGGEQCSDLPIESTVDCMTIETLSII